MALDIWEQGKLNEKNKGPKFQIMHIVIVNEKA